MQISYIRQAQYKNFKFQIFSIIFSLLLVFSTTIVSAQEEAVTATESSKIDYQLSYPGLLPDHPLYFLKAGRDRIVSFFISNPLKKSEFDLLQADKRIAASFLLIQKGEDKLNLSESTFSKGENYFEDAIQRARDAKSQGTNTSEIAKKLIEANLKHQEVLTDIEKKLSKKDQKKFQPERIRLAEFGKRVNMLDMQH